MSKELIKQINKSPELLRTYITGLELGAGADIVWMNEKLRQENEAMKAHIDKQSANEN